MRPHVPVSGDFDITARYELLNTERSEKGAGAGVVLLAVSPASKKMAKLCRLLRHWDGDRYLADITDHATNKIAAKAVPTQVRSGQLRLVREGSTIRYLVADGPEQEFREIHRDEFGARDVDEVAFVVSSHGGAEHRGRAPCRSANSQRPVHGASHRRGGGRRSAPVSQSPLRTLPETRGRPPKTSRMPAKKRTSPKPAVGLG